MGRVKLKIKPLEKNSQRHVKYSKRRPGILKKAKELALLCDTDLALLMFSPTGKPSYCLTEGCTIDDIIEKFAEFSPPERAKRKLKMLTTLKKLYEKLDHDVNIDDFLVTSTRSVEELSEESAVLQDQLTELHNRLTWWTDLEKIDDVEHLKEMEESLNNSICRLRNDKEKLAKHLEVVSKNRSNRRRNGTGGSQQQQQQQQSQSQIPSYSDFFSGGGEEDAMSSDSDILAHIDVECSTNSSLPSYSDFFGTDQHEDSENSGQSSDLAEN